MVRVYRLVCVFNASKIYATVIPFYNVKTLLKLYDNVISNVSVKQLINTAVAQLSEEDSEIEKWKNNILIFKVSEQ